MALQENPFQEIGPVWSNPSTPISEDTEDNFQQIKWSEAQDNLQ
jgi:hypothetical protein